MSYDGMLRDDRCERCSRLMSVHAMSYFNEESICPDCVAEERHLIGRLRLRGIDPATLAGCGYLPEDDTEAEGRHERRGGQPHA